MKAPIFASDFCPDRKATDQWLFLAQHVGLPTRLLDWTEGALTGLYFAVHSEEPGGCVVWMLNALELNHACTEGRSPSKQFPLTWYDPKDGTLNAGFENIAGAWEGDRRGTQLPIAVLPTNIHPRMSVQRSCFTVQGRDKRSLVEQVPALLKRYEIEASQRATMQEDLRLLGINHSTMWPNLDGLANELSDLY
jgi:hypothetical protein